MKENSAAWTVHDNFKIQVNNRQVTEINLYFFDNGPYVGLYLEGLSSDSTLKDFTNKFGSPIDESRKHKMFRSEQADISPAFEPDGGTLVILNIHEHYGHL